ncbi:MAG: hypothetical protein K9M45_11770, partial [Kiritimatiellales bacterium]|nr:hypothetical protein [Kiritimatiellales bacterium]
GRRMNPVFEAVYLNGTKIPDGAPAYPFAFSTDREGVPIEGTCVRFGWSATGLYVFAEMEDSCLVSTNRADEQLHYQTGDVLELFIKPADDFYYWEMYATPFGNKSTLFFPRNRAGMDIDQFLHAHEFQGLEVSSEATSNGWNARMFVPAEQLQAFGELWGPGSEWLVFCGRYNYNNEELVDPELSMAPPLSATNYHLTNEYAALRFCE